jgi:type II secretory pathway component PulJ
MIPVVRNKDPKGDASFAAAVRDGAPREEEQPRRADAWRIAGGARPRCGGDSRLDSFSVVELLVAMTVLSILVFVLLAMLSSLTNIWQEGQAHNERRTVAQAVLDRMSRDISQAALPMVQGNTNTLDFVINPTWVTANQYPQSIFFQAPVATDGGTNGNLAVVGYFIQWVNGSPGTPTLSRILINPSSPVYFVDSGTPNAWISNNLLTNAPATSAKNYAGLLAENVIGLWIQALDPSGNPITQSTFTKGEQFDSRYPYLYTNYGLTDNGNATVSTNMASALPASVQIAIAVIDSRTAKRLTAIPSHYTITGNFWNDIQNFYTNLPAAVYKGTEIQTTTIPLANGPR